jgi:molecular chaperone GrpE (heat shock protein)
MTANKLADYLESMADDVGHEGYHRYALVLKFEAPQFIREQQAEIEKLRKIVEDTIGQAFYEDDYRKAQAEIEALKKELAKNVEDKIYGNLMSLYDKESE